MAKRIGTFLRNRLRAPEVRDQIYRVISIALIVIAVGACVILVAAFMMQLDVLIVAFSGVLSVSLAFYLFVRLWPQKVPAENAPAKAATRPKPKPLSPEEYRRQRAKAQELIRDKAAPALAKAIRGYLQQDEMVQKEAWREKRK
ncbi:MAG: hypothetical protein ACI8V2_002449 [Candidatus Latescibacterota bacterium]